MRRTAERSLPAIDKSRTHSGRLGANAVKRVVGNEQHLVHPHSKQFRGRGVGRRVRLEGISYSHRDHAIERYPVIVLGGFELVGIAI